MSLTNRRLSYKAKIFANAVDRATNAALVEFNLTYTQSLVLAHIKKHNEDNICQKDIENYFNIKHPTATGILARLEQKGFITCAHSEYDKRRKIVHITESGIKVMQTIGESIEKTEAEFFANVTDEELETLNALFNKLLSTLDPTGKDLIVSEHKGGKE